MTEIKKSILINAPVSKVFEDLNHRHLLTKPEKID